jgi:hypothetical protein
LLAKNQQNSQPVRVRKQKWQAEEDELATQALAYLRIPVKKDYHILESLGKLYLLSPIP